MKLKIESRFSEGQECFGIVDSETINGVVRCISSYSTGSSMGVTYSQGLIIEVLCNGLLIDIEESKLFESRELLEQYLSK